MKHLAWRTEVPEETGERLLDLTERYEALFSSHGLADRKQE